MNKPFIVVGKFLMETFFANGNVGEITPEFLEAKAEYNFLKNARDGYRDGVVQISIPIHPDLKSNIVLLEDRTVLVGQYKSRVEGEEPRKIVGCFSVRNKPMPVKAVDLILYRRDVLEESGNVEHDGEWEIVKVNIKVVTGEQPMPPETLIANFYQLSGGTDTQMSNDQFVEALKVSVNFWKDKAYLMGKE